jgi:hypothetical protein
LRSFRYTTSQLWRQYCNVPDDILVNDETLAHLADSSTLVADPLDSTLRDCTARVTDLANLGIIQIIIIYGGCAFGDELSRENLEGIVLAEIGVDVGMLDRGEWGTGSGRSDGWIRSLVSDRVGTVSGLLILRGEVDDEPRVLVSASYHAVYSPPLDLGQPLAEEKGYTLPSGSRSRTEVGSGYTQRPFRVCS